MKERIIVLIVLGLMLAGCEGLGGGGSGSTKFQIYNPYFGSKGLTMEFLDSAPPDLMYQETAFKVGFLLRNPGAMDVDDAYISLSYLDKYYTIGNNPQGPISVKGKSFIRRNGERKPAYFSGIVEGVDYDGLVSPITATLCYTYMTRLVETVCIDPDIYGFETRQKACTVRDLILKDQGAPVAITRVKESIIEDGSYLDVYMKIHIRDLDGGLVANTPAKTLCGSTGLGEKEINRLRISAQLGDTPMECGKNGIVRLDAGEADVTCKARISAQEEYATALRVDLTYGYSKTLPQKSIELMTAP